MSPYRRNKKKRRRLSIYPTDTLIVHTHTHGVAANGGNRTTSIYNRPDRNIINYGLRDVNDIRKTARRSYSIINSR